MEDNTMPFFIEENNKELQHSKHPYMGEIESLDFEKEIAKKYNLLSDDSNGPSTMKESR